MEPELAPSQDDLSQMDPHLAEENKKYFTFFNLSIALIILTAIELVIIYLPFHPTFIMVSLVLMSGFKFLAVIWWFMHLRWDKVLCTAVFISGMVIATGTVTALLFLFEASETGAP
jgi:cytochrome c oxidase subunit IV